MSTKSLTILLICLIISFQGYAQNQRISLKITSPTPLNSVLLQIQQTSGINIIYLPTDLRQHPAVTLSASNIMLEQYLAQIIDPDLLAYNWSKGVLLLTPAPKHCQSRLRRKE